MKTNSKAVLVAKAIYGVEVAEESHLVAFAVVSRRDGHGWAVEVFWRGAALDRAHTFTMSFSAKNEKLARRYAAAVDAQAAFVNPKVIADVAGKTYVDALGLVLGRTANADLKRLGF